ncbi:A24 family peptidase [Sphingomonas cavernae]|uniref:Peptidase n=1 Tax=Sphingomonas cavernae TaxID=2320861 RepID=A0A418W5T9_9SPHN|nr:prepilin peptidase [Sphingomonas cavernae]RJF85410.1 peptidase [Sphingomonas cavernae]
MTGGFFAHILVVAVGGLMLLAAFTDVKRRQIDNWLNAAIALLAPLFWWANGYALWPDMAIQLAIGLAVFAAFAMMFALGAMGGGDVKMLGALALWLPLGELFTMLFIMAIAGGVLTAAMLVHHKIRKSQTNIEVPYGVAIAAGGLWVMTQPYLNHFA